MPYKNPEHRRIQWLKWYHKNRDALLIKKKQYWRAQREFVLQHYSRNKLCCKCCGEKTYEFLSLDHIKGGGNQHRKKLGSKYIFSQLISDGLPKGYQVLCHNCNLAKGFYGICPHKVKHVDQN